MKRSSLVLFIALTLLLSLSVTSQSLWIDEAGTAWLAAHRGLRDLAHAAVSLKTSDVETPLYLLFMWGWAKIFGTGEYALRASNIPFALLFVFSLGWTSSRVFGRPIFWTVFCISPFVVFYMNEARAYLSVMACAAASVAAMLAYFADRRRYRRVAPWICLSALVVACGLSMLAAFLVPMLLAYAFCAATEKHLEWHEVFRDWCKPLVAGVALLVVFGGYYAWTVLAGYGGQRGRAGLGNVAFALYEFIGLGGLGPPRNELRAYPSAHTLLHYWRWVAVGVVACATATATTAAIWFRRRRGPAGWCLCGALAAGLGLFLVAACLVSFRFWGRHLTVFFPMFVFLVILVTTGTGVSGRLRALEAVAFISLAVAWSISDMRLVSCPAYFKDDYRFAAAFALDEARRTGGSIAWAADALGARYYGIELGLPQPDVTWPVRGKGLPVANWTDAQVRDYLGSHRQDAEVILVLSKQDLFDRHGAWAAAVKRANAREIASANSFEIYALGHCQRTPR
jgi:hypothetical protein